MEDDLDALFDELNTRLFEGRLPTYRVQRCASHRGEHGFIDDATKTIWICDPPDVRATLLHEMCHIGTAGHGRLFRAKLRRLAQHGETWAQAERAYYLREELGLRAKPWVALWELSNDLRFASFVRA